MSNNIVYPSPASSRTIFREEFRSAAAVVANGGVLTGSPVVNRGMVCDGTQYATYAIPGSLLTRDRISFVCRFTPGFVPGDGDYYTFFDSAAANRSACYITLGGNLIVYFGGVFASVSVAAYQAHWIIGKQNTLTVSANGATVDVWLNSHQIIAGAALAFGSMIVYSLFIGARYDGNYNFLGTIHSLKIRSETIDANDVAAIQTNSLYSYRNKASVYLSMADQTAIPNPTNLLVDGDMEAAGVGAWGVVGGISLSKDTTDPRVGTQCLRCTSAGLAGGAQQAILVIGKRYRITGWMRGDGISQKPAVKENGTLAFVTGGYSTDWQYFGVEHTATGIRLEFWAANNAIGYTEFDDVSVQLVETQTSDKSGHGRNFLLGDGTTAATFPTFLNPSFRLDGATDYLSNPNASGIYNNASQSIVIGVRPDFGVEDGVYYTIMDTGAAGGDYRLEKTNVSTIALRMGNMYIGEVATAIVVPHWMIGGKNVFALVGTTGNVDLYLNGHLIGHWATAWSPVDSAIIWLGQHAVGTRRLPGDIFHFSTYPFMLGSIQVQDITEHLLNLGR